MGFEDDSVQGEIINKGEGLAKDQPNLEGTVIVEMEMTEDKVDDFEIMIEIGDH